MTVGGRGLVVCGFLCAGFLAGPIAPASAQDGAPLDIHIPYLQFTLENGLNVLVHRDASLPIASVNVWYHVGSMNEKPGRTGFAHLFEHVMFEGSAHVPEGDFDNLLESAGGVNNGSTSPDRTNYWENVPRSALELALWLEADRMGWLLETMDQAKLDLQRDVVKNERRQSYENRPYGLAFETLGRALYPPEHPYHWPTIGSMEDLSAASLDDVREFFRTWYVPGNASLAIAGDVEPRDVRRLVERYFGEIPAGPPVPEVMVEPAGLSSERRIVLEDDVQLPRLYLAWHSPGAYTDGDAAMELLTGVLADGKSSRLHRRLVYADQVAQDVSAFQDGQRLGGAFYLIVTARPGVTLANLEAVVRDEIAGVAGGTVTQAEMERARNRTETEFVRSLEEIGGFGGKADRLNEYYFYTGDPGFVRRDLARFRRATAADLATAARDWLVEAPAVVLSVVPRGRGDLAAGEPVP